MTTTGTGASVFTTGQIAKATGLDKGTLRTWVQRGHIEPEFGANPQSGEHRWGHGDVSILMGIRPMIASEFPAPVVKGMTERVRELRRAGAANHEIVIFTSRDGTRVARVNGSVREMIDKAPFGWVLRFPPLGASPK